MLPARQRESLIRFVVSGECLREPDHLALTVEALEQNRVAAYLACEIAEQGHRQSLLRKVGAVVTSTSVAAAQPYAEREKLACHIREECPSAIFFSIWGLHLHMGTSPTQDLL